KEDPVLRNHPLHSTESSSRENPIRLVANTNGGYGTSPAYETCEKVSGPFQRLRGEAALHQRLHYVAQRSGPKRDVHVVRVGLIMTLAVQHLLEDIAIQTKPLGKPLAVCFQVPIIRISKCRDLFEI